MSLKRLNGVGRAWACGFVFVLIFPCASTASTRALVVEGLGGNAEYGTAFNEQSGAVANAFQTITSSSDHIIHLSGPDANRAEFLAAMQSVVDAEISLRGTPDAISAFYLVMIGHGTMNRDGWQFNVSGPDISVADLVGALAPLQVDQQLVVASTSASGALLKPLRQPNRAVITATKSGGELNAVRFSEYFAAALTSNEADVDKNELLTVKEAFAFANHATQSYYEDQKLLASEHARLEGVDDVDLTLATLGALREAKDNLAVMPLLEQRSVLEKAFYAVKAKKNDLPRDEYYTELEDVLLRIAKLQQTIDAVISEGAAAQ